METVAKVRTGKNMGAPFQTPQGQACAEGRSLTGSCRKLSRGEEPAISVPRWKAGLEEGPPRGLQGAERSLGAAHEEKQSLSSAKAHAHPEPPQDGLTPDLPHRMG